MMHVKQFTHDVLWLCVACHRHEHGIVVKSHRALATERDDERDGCSHADAAKRALAAATTPPETQETV